MSDTKALHPNWGGARKNSGGRRLHAGRKPRSIKMDIDNTLARLLTKYAAEFNWDSGRRVWCLSGTDNGNGWETDDYNARTEADAKADAIEYLIGYNAEHPSL